MTTKEKFQAQLARSFASIHMAIDTVLPPSPERQLGIAKIKDAARILAKAIDELPDTSR